MSDTKHTPGPWRIENVASSPYGQLRIASTRQPLREDEPNVASGIYNPADARLIAAAPELLAALEAFAEHYRGRENQLGNGFAFQWLQTTARAAIARARGDK